MKQNYLLFKSAAMALKFDDYLEVAAAAAVVILMTITYTSWIEFLICFVD